MRISKIFISIILLFIAFGAKSQSISVVSKLDTNVVLIGDQIRLSLEANVPRDLEFHFPMLKDTIIKDVEVLEKSMIDTTFTNNQNLLLKQDFIVTSFDSGLYVIPAFNFTFKIGDRVDTLQSRELLLQVFTIPIDTTKQAIADIKQPIEASITFEEILPYTPIPLGAILLILLAIYIIRKIRRKEPIIRIPQKSKVPAHIIAVRDLDKLKDKKLWQQNKIKEYHSEVTEIIRTYIEDRFRVMALEQTSDEILADFDNSDLIDYRLKEALKQMFMVADLAKFAKAMPMPDENDLSMRNAYYFVDQTKVEQESQESRTKSQEGEENE